MKPILFKTHMVQAILDGRRTMTRRVINPDWIQSDKLPISLQADNGLWHFWSSGEHKSKCCIGDVLWVRETFVRGYSLPYGEWIYYKASFKNEVKNPKWKPAIFMPKKYARIFLRVTNVRVERLQDIPDDDVYAEGFPDDFYKKGGKNFRHWFVDLWNSINGKGAWEENQFVFVYEFQRIEKPN